MPDDEVALIGALRAQTACAVSRPQRKFLSAPRWYRAAHQSLRTPLPCHPVQAGERCDIDLVELFLLRALHENQTKPQSIILSNARPTQMVSNFLSQPHVHWR